MQVGSKVEWGYSWRGGEPEPSGVKREATCGRIYPVLGNLQVW